MENINEGVPTKLFTSQKPYIINFNTLLLIKVNAMLFDVLII